MRGDAFVDCPSACRRRRSRSAAW